MIFPFLFSLWGRYFVGEVTILSFNVYWAMFFWLYIVGLFNVVVLWAYGYMNYLDFFFWIFEKIDKLIPKRVLKYLKGKFLSFFIYFVLEILATIFFKGFFICLFVVLYILVFLIVFWCVMVVIFNESHKILDNISWLIKILFLKVIVSAFPLFKNIFVRWLWLSFWVIIFIILFYFMVRYWRKGKKK